MTMQKRFEVVFFLFPIFISIGLFINGAGTVTVMGEIEKAVYWVSVWVFMWAIAFYLSKVMLKSSGFFRRYRGLCFFLAIELSVWILRLLTPVMLMLINNLSYFDATYYVNEIGYYPADPERFAQFLYYSSFPVVVWIAVNYLFIEFGINLYPIQDKKRVLALKQANSNPNHPGIFKPVFLNNHPEIDPDDILAVSAEDHYINVITETKSTLIHFRFSDCLSEMQNVDGIRIHRSHWAKKEAIEKVERQGRKTIVTIRTGLTLPVSQTYLGCLEQIQK